MKLASHYRPERAADGNNPRPEFHDPYFDAPAGKVVATDGSMIFVAPAKREDREPSRFLSGGEGRAFPRWRSVLPAHREGDPQTITFGIDAALLVRACEALGADRDERRQVAVTIGLKATDHGTPFEVRGLNTEDEGRVFLMPVAIPPFDGRTKRLAVRVKLKGKRKGLAAPKHRGRK